jgi:phosphoglycolate phosphatase
MKKTILFDLDGTLVDVEPLFFQLFNQLASEFGYAPILKEEIPRLKQRHLRSLVLPRLGWRIVYLAKILRRGREEYNKLASQINLFPGIAELLTTLHTRGYRIGIVSSSRQDTIEALVKHHALPIDFIRSGKLFNKAQSLRDTLKDQNLVLAETLYIGDEVRDVEACQKVGLEILAVTWGLNSKEALRKAGAETIDTREELLARIIQ